jgi:photosystem II stability/assembly factor-like uncharacterized protein
MTRLWRRTTLVRRWFLFPALGLGATLLLAPGASGYDLTFLSNWQSIGPEPSCCFLPGGDTGRATAIAVNPLNKNDVWLGTAGGGVWHSPDAGLSWLPMSDDQPSLAIGSIALAGCSASHCSAVYAGTGENAIRRDTYYGAGLLVGTFDGVNISWERKNGGPTYSFTRGSITGVVLNPTTSGPGQVLYITLSSGVSASATESTVTAPEPKLGGYGIYKSVDNGGSFTKVWSGGRPTDLEIDRLDHNVLYAGVLGKGVFRSKDAGATWCPLNPGIPQPPGCNLPWTGLPDLNNWTFDHIEIATDPHLPQAQSHLFATLGRCSDPLLNNCAPALYESSNGGDNWVQRHFGSTTPYPSDGVPDCPYGYSRYTHALTIDPADPGTVFVGGVHLCRWSQPTGWKEADASALPCSSNVAGNGQPYERCTLHYDHHAVVFAPNDPMRAYNASDGGFAVSTDGGATWSARNDGLGIVEFQSLASSPFSESLIGGTQDNAGMEWVGSFLWSHLECCGDGGFAVMERDPSPASKQDDIYVTSNTGTVAQTIVLPIRSKDGGTTFPSPPGTYGYDVGIDNEDVRSFYPPLVEEDTNFDLYFGTNALFRSTNGSDSYSAVSPVLSDLDAPEIVGGKDVITAVAVAPTNPNRIYIGYYSGKTFSTTAPCSGGGCWTPNSPLGGPVTWIAVDPWTETTAYATTSGFAKGGHVFKTTTGGSLWSKLPTIRELAGQPANTLLVNPQNPDVIYLGTDKGIYRSTSAGWSWARFSNGLPNVPVYAFTYTGDGTSLVAATHGRGAWMLSHHHLKPWVDGPNDELVLDGPVLGQGFPPEQDCVLTITRQDGTVCASGPNDALGGRVRTDRRGFLTSSKTGLYSGLPVVWACTQGKCLDSDVMGCNRPGNPMAAVQAACGGRIARSDVDLAQSGDDPPSALLGLGSLVPAAGSGLAGALDPAAAAAGSPAAESLPAAAPSGSFTLSPVVQAGDGSTRVLCSVGVALQTEDSSADVLQRAGAAVNGDAACRAAGVGAAFQSGDRGDSEDLFPGADRLALEAPLLNGSRLIPAVQTAPGGMSDLCLRIGRIDRPSRSQVLGMRLRFATGTGGAAGGAVHVTERSSLGDCSVVASIPAHASAGDVAQAVAAAFQAPGLPGPPGCLARHNPRDVSRRGDSVLTAFASEVVICVADAGVGVSLAPEEICIAPGDCDDANPCTTDTCNGAGQCVHTAVSDGASCDDGKLCTVGNTCVAGACGMPRLCDDGNACTADACDPATGACVAPAPPIVCDDGNICTQDRCDAASGRCVFAPLTGSTCSDGDPCTSGDSCVLSTGAPAPLCTGTFACADTDACTSDTCDPLTGACANAPIECEDGDPCTLDHCQAGACVSTIVTGVSCDDEDRCTTGDRCEVDPFGATVCSGVATSCDDGNACTVDACDAVTGGCTHAPPGLGTVSLLRLLDPMHVTWSTEPGAVSYNSYRGTIPDRGLGSRPPASRYDQTCFEAHDAAGDGAVTSIDPGIPLLGTAFYYLASEAAACGEGPIGHDSNGTPIPNSAPCPP